MKKQIVLFFTIFLLLPIVYAAQMDISVEQLSDRVIAGGTAEYLLKIKNNQVREDTFQVSADSLSVHPFSDIIYSITTTPSLITIPTGREKAVTLSIKFKEDVKPDRNYVSYVWVKSINNPNIRVKYPISSYVISQKEIIKVTPELPKDISPGKKIPFDIIFKNQLKEEFKNLDVFITSPVYSEQSSISLGSYEELTKGFLLNIASLTNSGEYTLSIRVFSGNEIKGEKVLTFDVIESPELKFNKETKSSFLSSKLLINYENVGNKQIEKTVTYPKISFFKKLFTSVSPKADLIKEDGKYYYSWAFILEPGESFVIEITTSFRWLFILGVLILLGFGLFYYIKTRHVIINKKIFKLKEEGGSSNLKVLLHIINKTTSEIHQLRIIDLLPNMIKLDEDFGTLRPTHLQKGAAGIRLIWEIPLLEPGEERVLSYKFKSKMRVIGRISLPSASVQYHGRNKKLINIKSNRAFFLI